MPALFQSVTHTATGSHLVLKADNVYQDTLARAVQGNVLIVLPDAALDRFTGDVVLVRGTMQQAQGKRNPGEFDYAAYLAQKHIHALLYAEEVVLLKPANRQAGVRQQAQALLTRWIHRFVAEKEARALLQALLLGEQSSISAATREAFRQAGLAHLLAVSGLHMLCIGLVMYTLLRPVCMRLGADWRVSEAMRTGITVLLLGSYMMLTGGRPSVVRAFLMTTAVIFSTLVSAANHNAEQFSAGRAHCPGDQPLVFI